MNRPPPPTKRLTFRQWSLSSQDVDNLFKIFGDPASMTYYPRPKTRAETRDLIVLQRLSYRENGMGLWALEMNLNVAPAHFRVAQLRKEFVGQCGAVIQIVDGQREFEIGYHLLTKYRGLGLASEAARGVRDWLIMRGQGRPICLIDPANHPSQKVAQSIGMKIERQALMWNKVHDVWRYSE